MPEGDSPGLPGVSQVFVRDAVTGALAAMANGRLDLAKGALEALLRAMADKESGR